MNSVRLAVIAGLVLGLSATASAGPLDAERKQLWSPDLKVAMAAAKRLGDMRTKPALDLLMETLQLGAPTQACRAGVRECPDLAHALLIAISTHRSARAINLLESYGRNRNPKLRAEAVRAVGMLPEKEVAPRVIKILQRALADGDVQVRMAGAWVIGERKQKELPLPSTVDLERTLITLLERGDTAAPAIGLGAIGGYFTARYLAVNLKKLPEITIAKVYRTLLLRRDFGPDPVRYWVVRALGEMKGTHATEVLATYAADPPVKGLRSVVAANRLMEK